VPGNWPAQFLGGRRAARLSGYPTEERWRVVGHQIEYFAAVPEANVRGWLDRLDGFYCSDPGDVPFSWEGQLRSGGTVWAHMAPAACNFSLAMKYTALWSGWPPAVDFARRFEAEFWEQFGPVPLLRVDEFLVGEWFRGVGREWEQFERPAEELAEWLRARGRVRRPLAPARPRPKARRTKHCTRPATRMMFCRVRCRTRVSRLLSLAFAGEVF